MTDGTPSSPMRTVKQVVIAVIILVVIIVLLQNRASVTFHFLFWGFGISQILLIVLMLLIGFVAGLLTYSLITRKKRRAGNGAGRP